MKSGKLLIAYASLLLLVSATAAYAAGGQALRCRTEAVSRAWQAVGRLPSTNQLHVALCLPLRNTGALTNLLAELYNPGSPNFRHYLSAEEFDEQFSPTREDYASVVTFAQAQGLRVTGTHPNRMLVDLAGTAGDFERVFHTALRVYYNPRERRHFHAPDSKLAIDLAVPVLSVCGLDDAALPRPAGMRPAGAAVKPMANVGPAGYLKGADFRKAYAPGVTLTGAGQRVGLLQFDGYYASDIASYVSRAGITSVPLQNVLLDGFNGVPGSYNSEVAMDIEMVTSMAPGLSSIIVYEAGMNGLPIDVLNRMATDNLAKQLSASWTWGTLDPGTEQVFQKFAAQGQSYFNASGDSGAYSGFIDAPADDPYITIVGGTTLSTDVNGAWQSETVWNWGSDNGASGGGISPTYSMPNWQGGVSMAANQGSTLLRNIPDVAMAADDIWVAYGNGSSSVFGGTSAASPLWAAFTALVNQQAVSLGYPTVGFLNPALYTVGRGTGYGAAFHDITTGDNKPDLNTAGFSAVSGYDLCTGWGTPTGQAMIDALVASVVPVPTATLTVQTAHGTVSPGTTTVPIGNLLTERVKSPVVNGSTQFVCTGASVTGNDFTQVSPTNVTLTLTNAATLVWNWQMQYRLTAAVSGSGTVTPGGWMNPGDTAVLTALIGSASHFTGWSGQTGGCVIAGNVITVPMTQSRSITAMFAAGLLPVISGRVTQSGTSTGLTGVPITFSGLLTTNTDSNGYYSITVPYGWSGVVRASTNSLGGGGFSPVSKSYNNLTTYQTGQNFSWIPPPVISGAITRSGTSVGLSGLLITITGQGTTTTDSNGMYSVTVPYGWTGTVKPSTNGLAGAFSAANKAYGNLTTYQSGQNYSWIPPPVISGTITRAGTSVGLTGVLLTISGQGTTTTAGDGTYSVTVPYGWTGTVKPSTNGIDGAFFAVSKSYNNLTTYQIGQNYSWTPPPTISGAITRAGTSVGVAGVTVTFSGLGTTVTAGNGTYALTVPYKWSGTVRPLTNGVDGVFSLVSKSYSLLTANQTGQNYSWTPPPLISGRVTYAGSTTGAVGVVVTFSGVGTTVTDGSGLYSMTVPYNWTGTATPSAGGGTFVPASKSYSAVKANAIGQNYAWTAPAAPSARGVPAVNADVTMGASAELLHAIGSVRWLAADEAQVRKAPVLLNIDIQDGASIITLPSDMPGAADVASTVILAPALQGLSGAAGAHVLLIRNQAGAVTADTLQPDATVLGSLYFLPSGEFVVLTWDLTLSRP